MDAPKTLSTWPRQVVRAPGRGSRARICRATTVASRLQSIHSSSRDSLGAMVACAGSWGRRGALPSATRRRVSPSSWAPSRASRSWSWPAVTWSSSGIDRWRMMSPVSSPSSIHMVVTPVTASPARMAHWMGAAPRWRGSREAWTLMAPSRGTWSTAAGRIFPYATTTSRSGRQARSCSTTASSSRSGWSTGMPYSAATALTGGAAGSSPRPWGRSGWVMTPTTRTCRCRSSSRLGTAKAGVPMKTTRRSLSGGSSTTLRARSVISTPSRWSISCCRQRASSPSPSIQMRRPRRSRPVTCTDVGRSTSASRRGRERHPS